MLSKRNTLLLSVVFTSYAIVLIKNDLMLEVSIPKGGWERLYIPRDLKMRSLASLISWNFFVAEALMSSPRVATRSG